MIADDAVTLQFYRGFPPRSGAYLVHLGGSEYVVTYWNDPNAPGVDTWGDERRGGWACLTGSHSRVLRWAALPNAYHGEGS